VIGRYGASVLGGAERLARAVAERLVLRGHDVRVLTSCARDYRTWANEYASGVSVECGVQIERYPTTHCRRPGDNLLKWMSSACPRVSLLSRAWISAQGPHVPELLERLQAEAGDRDLLVFFQLLTYPTILGVPLVSPRCVLVPMVHNEFGVRTDLARRTLTLPQAVFANTHHEAETIAALTGSRLPSLQVVGVGLDSGPSSAAALPSVPRPYLAFLGRVGKITPLLRTWRALMTDAGLPGLVVDGREIRWKDVHLVIVGERSEEAARLPNVVQLGYVDDATRWAVLQGAVALVNPSLYESLSLVMLESWSVGLPVVVNARCGVTADLVRRSGGGIAVDFRDPHGAAASIARDLAHEPERANLGKQGGAFATATFAWDRVLEAYESAARLATAAGISPSTA
jgi:glycosyltransferase involved in cell wall biosynthesis